MEIHIGVEERDMGFIGYIKVQDGEDIMHRPQYKREYSNDYHENKDDALQDARAMRDRYTGLEKAVVIAEA